MCSLARTLVGPGILGVLLIVDPAHIVAQSVHERVAVAAHEATALQRWGARVDEMVRHGELLVHSAYADRTLPDHGHEVLKQYYAGVPVHGGELMIHKAQGVAISMLGTVYSGIELETALTITADEAAAVARSVSGARLGPHQPTLTIYPVPFGGYALVYLVSLSNLRTYIVDAHDGRVKLDYSDIRHQSSSCRPGAVNCSVGIGVSSVGDLRKLSTTAIGGTFETRDAHRPAEILTLDLRNDLDAFERLAGTRGANPGVLPSDIARDADNTWTDRSVVDTHVHLGWVYDYFSRQHGYRGIDNANGRIFALVNPSEGISDSNAFFVYPPAGPEGTGYMVFGRFSNGFPFASLDFVGHEVTHGVIFFRPAGPLVRFNFPGAFGSAGCSPTADIPLVRNGQVVDVLPADYGVPPGSQFICEDGRFAEAANVAGAVGEAFGDVFGTSTEFFHADLTTPDYLMGEDFGSPFRSLENPASLRRCVRFADGELLLGETCPDHWSRRIQFPLIMTPDGFVFYWAGQASDFGAEHMNAGIFSHAFFLAIEGGTNRTSGLTVNGVGSANRDAIEEIFLSAVLDRIPNNPGWFDVSFAIVQAAVDRFGAASAETAAVFDALDAVGLVP